MLRELRVKKVALGLLLASAASIAAHAQLVGTPAPSLPGYCNGGPTTVLTGEVSVHAALDDGPLAPAMSVTLRLYDSEGTVVARHTATIAPGKTTTLEYRGGGGLLRPQVTFDTLVNPSERRRTVASAEFFDDDLHLVVPLVCFPNERIAF
jgi:hypothetical protein